MPVRLRIVVFAVLALAAAISPARAATDTGGFVKGRTEEFRYSWRLRGVIGAIAGLAMPTSGSGRWTTEPTSNGAINSELHVTASRGNGFYLYQSEIDGSGRTLMTHYSYAWGKKSGSQRTLFDWVKGLARIRKETPDEVEQEVKLLPSEDLRDVLTAIHYLRVNAGTISAPVSADLYSDGKVYPIQYKPLGARIVQFEGAPVATIGYEVTATPGARKKWPGGVKVWLSDDERRVPMRIEIQRNFATLDLDVLSIAVQG